MSIDVPPLGASERTSSTAPGAAPGAPRFEAVAPAGSQIPASPPAEVMRDVEAAARRAEWLREHGHELRFEVDPETRSVRVEVRNLEGELVRVVPVSEGLAIATGAPIFPTGGGR
ncbi:MAG: hypothetical protein M3N16_07225 [Actinomycetota bacterium]|nr:hypothetical protein [Actinomycetota bacterium]